MNLALESIGLIAGSKSLPLELARLLRAAGVRRIVCVAAEGNADPAIAGLVDDIVWVHPGQINKLRTENQANYTYKIEGNKTLNGVQTVVLRFNEKGKGHLMTNASALGRYWIDPATGAVCQTELGFSSAGANIHGTVTFAKDKQLGVLVPSELSETVEASSPATGMNNMGGGGGARDAREGRATYTKYRRAGV